MIRHARAFAALCIAVAVASCHIEEPFARTNHWDKDADVDMRLDGPDSVFSLGDTTRILVAPSSRRKSIARGQNPSLTRAVGAR